MESGNRRAKQGNFKSQVYRFDNLLRPGKKGILQEGKGRAKVMDIRTKTGLIIRKEGKFLVACEVGTNKLIWRDSPYDAWFTRNREDAERVISVTGGELTLFNPIAGQVRTAKF